MTQPPEGNGPRHSDGLDPRGWQPDPQHTAQQPDAYGQPYQGQPYQGQPYQGQPYQGQPYGQPQQPAAPYGQPQQSAAPYGYPQSGTQPQPEVFDSAAPTRKRGKAPAILAAVATLAVVTGVGVFALTRTDPAGDPTTAVAATADMVLTADLNPSPAKKLELYNFVKKFPSLKADLDKLGASEKSDIKAMIVKELLKDSKTGLDYATDVEPWLGDSIAVAATVRDGEPQPYFAIQSKDNTKAKAALAKLDTGATTQYDFVGGYAIVWEKGAASPIADIKARPLSGDDAYRKDMESVGKDALVTLWANEKVAEAVSAGQSAPIAVPRATGRFAGVLDVSGDSAQLKIGGMSAQAVESTGDVKSLIGTLPADTDLVVAGAIDEPSLRLAWAAIESTLGAGISELPLTLPDDAIGVLTPAFAITADAASLLAPASGTEPKVALTTEKGTIEAHTKVVQALGLSEGVSTVAGDGVVVTGTDQAYVTSIARPTSKLVDDPVFAKAVDLSGKPSALLFLNPATLASAIPAGQRGDLAAVSSVSMVSVSRDADRFEMTVRLTAK